MNYLIYPLKVMNITQGYKGKPSHKKNSDGYPKDYPIDDNGGSTKQDAYFYCPCDKMIVKRIYGVGNSGTNTIWLESMTKVKTPTFEDYITILIIHPEDKDLRNILVGDVYERGSVITLEGKDGNATGYHFHISVGRGKFKGNGWVKNSLGAWVINTSDKAVKPEDAFYINPDFTTIKNDGGLNFKKINLNNIGYVACSNLNIRNGGSLNSKIINTIPKRTQVGILKEKNGWLQIGINQWVFKEYITLIKPKVIYKTKTVNTGHLNVRKTPNGSILKVNAPLPKNTIVADVNKSGNWTKINKNRWVYTYYLK